MTLPQIARRTDLSTSHEAARRITENGTRQTHSELVLRHVIEHPGHTAAELGVVTQLGHIEAQRRLSDLMRQGRVYQGAIRACSIKGSRMVTWFPATHEPKQEQMWPE